jgi:hypothetical protein
MVVTSSVLHLIWIKGRVDHGLHGVIVHACRGRRCEFGTRPRQTIVGVEDREANTNPQQRHDRRTARGLIQIKGPSIIKSVIGGAAKASNRATRSDF